METTVEWYWQWKTEELRQKTVPMPLCPQQIPHGLTRAQTLASAVRGRRQNAWAIARSLLGRYSHIKCVMGPVQITRMRGYVTSGQQRYLYRPISCVTNRILCELLIYWQFASQNDGTIHSSTWRTRFYLSSEFQQLKRHALFLVVVEWTLITTGW
jgi:hypothetical protein